MRNAIEQGDLGLFNEVLQVVQLTGALEYTRQQARRESKAACSALAALPDTVYKKSLMELADFAASRTF